MGMLSVSGDALDRLGHKGRRQSELVEYVTYHVFYVFFIVGSLHGSGIFPVYLKLFHDVVVAAGACDLRFYASDFFMPHFHFNSIIIEYFQSLFQSRPDRSVSSLPVLFLEFLGSGKLFLVSFVFRRPYPKLQLGGAGDEDFFQVIRAVCSVDILKHVRVLTQQLHETALKLFH